jgi:hypothetical protein
MSTMICGNCGRYGIYWKNLGGLQPYTYCPNCNGTNCQKPEEPHFEEEGPDEEDSNLSVSEIEQLKFGGAS